MKNENVIDPIEKVLDNNGAFWAFGDNQFKEQRVDGVAYVSLGAGLICPRENVEKLEKELNEAIAEKKRAEREKLDERARELKIDKLPIEERIHNRKILIREAMSRINNYMDSCEVAEYYKIIEKANGVELLEEIDGLLRAISWRVDSRREMEEVYVENIKVIEELKQEIAELIK